MGQRQDLKIIYTLGTSNRTLEEFLAILKQFGLKQVIDVRSFPQSRRFPHFSQNQLAKVLAQHQIAYHWLGPELGGFRREGYENYVKTEAFKEGLEKLLALAQKAPSVIICAERFPWRCHRRFISQKLAEQGVEVRHIIEPGKVWCPKKQIRPKLMFPL